MNALQSALPSLTTSGWTALFIIAVLVAWIVATAFGSKSSIRLLPMPRSSHLIWGHEKEVYARQPGKTYRKWAQELGLTYRIKAALGAPDVLVLNDPGGIAHILQRRIYNYHHSMVVRPRVARLLGKGLGWVEGETEHKRMRQLVSPSLSRENVKSMSQDVRLGTLQIIDELALLIQSQSTDSTVNVVDWMAKATLNVIGRVGFLHDFDGGNSQEAQQILGGRRHSLTFVYQYVSFLSLMLFRRFPILNSLPILAVQSQSYARLAVKSGVARELLRRNTELVKSGSAASQQDLLSRLLVAHASGAVSEEELYDQISTFIIAGHETTTQVLSFSIYEISRHEDVQRRLRDELSAFKWELSFEDYASRTPYLDAVLKETLRMYPALPYMERVAMKDDIIPLREPVRLENGQVVSEIPVTAGQVVIIPIIAIHRMDSVWKDPDVFRPERWLEELPPTKTLCSGWANTLAFSDGPRNCVGRHFAIFEYKVMITYLLQRFQLRDAGMDVNLKVSSSLQAFVQGREDLGPCLPATLEIL
ncbi:cytochrome P450 [Earliella scabrosa]|nr:cytochrome P450 [Earliella scabrosa]